MKRSLKILKPVFFAILLFSCKGAPPKMEKVTFVLDWTPNTNHSGIYAARDEGWYTEAGLDVEIIQPANGTADQLVVSGRADFGMAYQESVTVARAEGSPVVSIGAVLAHNTSGFAAPKDRGIRSPADFAGKKYGGWGSPIEEATIKYLMEKSGADSARVEVLTTGFADFFQATASRQIDFAWIFSGWAGIEAKLKGIELDYIDLGALDPVFDYYTPVIIASENTIAKNRTLAEKFMKATAKGYAFCAANPEEAAAILLKAVPELDPALVKESQQFLSSRYRGDSAYWGEQKKEVWERYAKWLYLNGFIKNEINVKKAFTNEFLPKKQDGDSW